MVGLGFAQHRLLDNEAWASALSGPPETLRQVDGHFVAAVADKDQVVVRTDQLGTRTLHYAPYAGGYAFSSRLDWIAGLCGGLDVDYDAFGSHWITFNQLSTRSQVQGLSRLGPGGVLTLRGGKAAAAERLWACDFGDTDRDGDVFTRALSGYCRPLGMGKVSLGLSGGLDSRLLLALGAEHTHVFGPKDHIDVRLAQRIARGEGVPQRHLHQPCGDAEKAWGLLMARSETTQVVSAASSVMDLEQYVALRREGFSIIDGGFGEVARRQFMNRLLRFGKGWAKPSQVLPHIRVGRAAVFSKDAQAAMTRGALRDITFQRDALPNGINPEDAADLIGVRTRLPNFFGLEQNRLDHLAACLMPFAQPSVLRALFRLPLVLRRNGTLFKRLIRSRRPGLARYPLVKGATVYPFRLPTLGAHLVSRFKKKAGLAYRDPRPHQYLEAVKPYALDLVHATDVRTYAAYDYQRLKRLVLGYYEGQTALAGSVDWWLAFELWRQTLKGPR